MQLNIQDFEKSIDDAFWKHITKEMVTRGFNGRSIKSFSDVDVNFGKGYNKSVKDNS